MPEVLRSGMAVSPVPLDATPTGRLYVVRHGQTEWSRTHRHTGRTDLPLEAAGIGQAEEVGRRLAGHHFARVLVSPLLRAQQTCEAAGFGAMAETCHDLREWDYGAYEGLTSDEIFALDPGWSLWKDGVPGGESPAEVGRRADAVVALVRSRPGDVLAFAHGHILRVVAARWVGLAPSDGARLSLDPATISVLGWEHGRPVATRWNDAGGRLFD
jgi:broad specificity phosphatase PhoE